THKVAVVYTVLEPAHRHRAAAVDPDVEAAVVPAGHPEPVVRSRSVVRSGDGVLAGLVRGRDGILALAVGDRDGVAPHLISSGAVVLPVALRGVDGVLPGTLCGSDGVLIHARRGDRCGCR